MRPSDSYSTNLPKTIRADDMPVNKLIDLEGRVAQTRKKHAANLCCWRRRDRHGRKIKEE